MDLFNDSLFKALFDTAVPRVILKAEVPDFTILDYNRAYEIATHNIGKDIRGKTLWEVYAPEQAVGEGATVLPDALTRAVINRETIYMPPFHYDIPSAEPGKMETSWWELEIVYIPATEKNKDCLLVTTYNITERIISRQSVTEGLEREQELGKELAVINEELSAANEELAAANEEITASNEELYDSNEELAMLNDELGMMNEELMHAQLNLQTLYSELEQRVEDRTRELAESEQQFRQLADSIIQMVWITNEKGILTYYNKRWEDFVGRLNPAEGEADWYRIFHPDDADRIREVWLRSLETGEPYELEYRLKNLSGEYIWILGRAAPFYDKTGKISRWFGTCTDINELKKAEAKKDDFISIASHELKTPVTSLKASLQLLNKYKEKDSAQKMIPALVDQACRSSDRVSRLIDDLLNISKLNQGQLHLNKKHFKLAEVIEECCGYVQLAGEHKVLITGDTDVNVYADAGRIDQVMVNFINNAVKHSPVTETIQVKIEKEEKAVRVSVIDKGIGIPKEKLPHLFERYYKVDEEGAQYSGLGLGLYISAEIIRKHEGEIGVDSEPGKGSSFWFTLPIHL
ncbi:MAG: ATP-binding protein [Pedobacter sp.]|uniref:ATP-binding protein n=1 Tax=Pedobacter sp. TaxID=1411316 RepID=UPI003396AE1D